MEIELPQVRDEMTKQVTLEERILEAMEMVESGHESTQDWELLRCVWKKLLKAKQAGKLSGRGCDVMELMAPIINKYGQAYGIQLDPHLAHK